LPDGHDFPYFETRGFTEERIVLLENLAANLATALTYRKAVTEAKGKKEDPLGSFIDMPLRATCSTLLAVGLLTCFATGCSSLRQVWHQIIPPDMVWFQKDASDTEVQSDLEACKYDFSDRKALHNCMQAKGYLLIPQTEAELLKVKSLQDKGLEEQDIASQLGWKQKKVSRYTNKGFELGYVDALGRQPVDVLASLGKPVVPQLIDELKNHDPLVRRQAAQALGEIKDLRAVEPLIDLLKDKDPLIRRHAVKALGKIEDAQGVTPLIGILNDKSEQPHVRMTAAEALGRIGKRRAVEPLVAALKDSHWTVRSRAAKALGTIRDSRAVGPLVLALQDEDPSVRGHVVDALGEIKDPRAEEPLRSALKDTDKDVRKRAEQALAKIIGNFPNH
jgi:hypothetical protein